MATKVKLRVIGLTYSQTQTGSYALVLAEENGRRRIPIMIGAFEAQAIALHLEDLQPPRPLTHDLFRRFSMAFGIELKEVFINKLSEGIFYSELLFDREGEMARIDSRTSDAVALALRYKCPIYTTPEILEQAGIILEDKADMLDPEVETDTAAEPSGLSSKSAEELNMLLEEAVTNEDYETASEIRDELKRRHKKA
ncbi:MAG: bifunctional nuclease family protein [Bacteroidales bacterium]|nr:bifunctional nuclease family protein [Bacteroidales bacterium]